MSKLTRENKIEIYERRKNGETISSLAKSFNIHESKIKYLIALIKKHEYDILRNGKNRYYSKEFKLQTINRILVNFESVRQVAIDIGLASDGILHNWLSKFKENGYNIVEKKKARKPKSMTKPKKSNKILSEKDKIKQLEDEIIYLKAENEYLKKLRALVQERELKEKKIIQSMSRKGNSLDNGLMECFFGLLKSEMFYEQEEKYKILEELKEAIEDYIYYYNNKRIKEKLKGLTPASYRSKSLLVS